MSVTSVLYSGADGDTITAGNTGSDTPFTTGGTAVIKTSPHAPGTARSVLHTSTVTAGIVGFTKNLLATTATLNWLIPVRVTANLSAIGSMIRFLDGSNNQLCALYQTATGTVRMIDAAGATVWTSTAALTVGSWFYVGLYATRSATVGTMRAAVYDQTGTLVEDSTLFSTLNTGAVDFARIRTGGKPSTGTQTGVMYTGEPYQYDTAAAGLLAPTPHSNWYIANPTGPVLLPINETVI